MLISACLFNHVLIAGTDYSIAGLETISDNGNKAMMQKVQMTDYERSSPINVHTSLKTTVSSNNKPVTSAAYVDSNCILSGDSLMLFGHVSMAAV